MQVLIIDYWIDKKNNKAYCLTYQDGQLILSEGDLEVKEEDNNGKKGRHF